MTRRSMVINKSNKSTIDSWFRNMSSFDLISISSFVHFANETRSFLLLRVLFLFPMCSWRWLILNFNTLCVWLMMELVRRFLVCRRRCRLSLIAKVTFNYLFIYYSSKRSISVRLVRELNHLRLAKCGHTKRDRSTVRVWESTAGQREKNVKWSTDDVDQIKPII